MVKRKKIVRYWKILFVCCRLHNKGVYFKIGLRKMMIKRSCKDLHQAIRLEVDGKLVDVPPVEGIIILNILRFVLFWFFSTEELMMPLTIMENDQT